jgi:hypothetical protein
MSRRPTARPPRPTSLSLSAHITFDPLASQPPSHCRAAIVLVLLRRRVPLQSHHPPRSCVTTTNKVPRTRKWQKVRDASGVAQERGGALQPHGLGRGFQPPRRCVSAHTAPHQLKKAFFPFLARSTLFFEPSPVELPICSAPPFGRSNLKPSTAMESKSNSRRRCCSSQSKVP